MDMPARTERGQGEARDPVGARLLEVGGLDQVARARRVREMGQATPLLT